MPSAYEIFTLNMVYTDLINNENVSQHLRNGIVLQKLVSYKDKLRPTYFIMILTELFGA